MRNKIKNEIDLKVDSLKAELDELRDGVFKVVDHRCDKALEYIDYLSLI